MPVLWEPHYDAMWQMFAGQRRSPGDKRKAYTVAGAFWTDTVQPFITDPANKTIFERASVTKRAQWLGQLLHELLPGLALRVASNAGLGMVRFG